LELYLPNVDAGVIAIQDLLQLGVGFCFDLFTLVGQGIVNGALPNNQP
jgi:hypothetical protein